MHNDTTIITIYFFQDEYIEEQDVNILVNSSTVHHVDVFYPLDANPSWNTIIVLDTPTNLYELPYLGQKVSNAHEVPDKTQARQTGEDKNFTKQYTFCKHNAWHVCVESIK